MSQPSILPFARPTVLHASFSSGAERLERRTRPSRTNILRASPYPLDARSSFLPATKRAKWPTRKGQTHKETRTAKEARLSGPTRLSARRTRESGKRPSAGDKRRLQSEMKPRSRTNAERPAYPEPSLAPLFGFFRISFRTRTVNSGRML